MRLSASVCRADGLPHQVSEVTTNKKMLKSLEDDLLYRLANSTGNLLDDTSLIEVLQNTKETSTDVNAKLEVAVQTDRRISAAREEYVLAIDESLDCH